MARIHAVQERVTYAVTSRNNKRGATSGVLCGSASRSLLRNCAEKNIPAAVSQHARRKEVVFSVGPPRGYVTRITGQLELGLGEVEPSAWGYNRATLFLGDINTGTWSSRLGESQI
jgi:hypothetical protein